MRGRILLILSAGALLGCAQPSGDENPAKPVASARPAATKPAAEPVRRLRAGEIFPAGVFDNLNPRGPATIDLSADLGTRPVILYYWIAGNRRTEDLFRELEALVGQLEPGRIALYGVAVPRANLATAPVIRNTVQMMGLETAVLDDRDFSIGQRVGAERVPYVSIIDAEGRLRLTNGVSLSQQVGPELDLAETIRRAATTGQLQQVGQLPRYYPVVELEGEPAPDFQATLLADRTESRWSELLDADRPNVLIFWSVDCPHCREEIPRINDWVRRNSETVNVVTCARALDESTRLKTEQFRLDHDLAFPTLVDGNSSIVELYKITTTPTVLIIGSDGVVESAIVAHDHETGLGAMIEQELQALARASGPTVARR